MAHPDRIRVGCRRPSTRRVDGLAVEEVRIGDGVNRPVLAYARLVGRADRYRWRQAGDAGTRTRRTVKTLVTCHNLRPHRALRTCTVPTWPKSHDARSDVGTRLVSVLPSGLV